MTVEATLSLDKAMLQDVVQKKSIETCRSATEAMRYLMGRYTVSPRGCVVAG